MKKKIGISLTEINFKNYWNWFTKDVQDDVELIELSFQKNNTEDIFTCDGFVLTGGVDIHPDLYGGQTNYNNQPGSFLKNRDEFEEKIYKYSQENKKPLLGICRGLQLVNVLQGGKLIQDMQFHENDEQNDDDDTDQQHEITVEKDTLLYNITHSDKGLVNSAHHQAIDPNAIGDNLKVNAYGGNNNEIIEGIEFKDKTNKAFMLCVQWHPERMPDLQSNFSKNIKISFLEAVSPPP